MVMVIAAIGIIVTLVIVFIRWHRLPPNHKAKRKKIKLVVTPESHPEIWRTHKLKKWEERRNTGNGDTEKISTD
jgi:hypothetical protein